MRILIVDDHAIVRDGLSRLLAADGDTQVSRGRRRPRGAGAWRAAAASDLIILDLNLPGLGGLELLRRLMQAEARPGSWSCRCTPSRSTPRRALEAGAAGYVSKNAAPDELLAAVRRVAGGGRYVEAEIAQALALGGGAGEPLDALSPRELEIMRLLAGGAQPGRDRRGAGRRLQDRRQHLQPDQVQARRRAHRRPGAAGDRDRRLLSAGASVVGLGGRCVGGWPVRMIAQADHQGVGQAAAARPGGRCTADRAAARPCRLPGRGRSPRSRSPRPAGPSSARAVAARARRGRWRGRPGRPCGRERRVPTRRPRRDSSPPGRRGVRRPRRAPRRSALRGRPVDEGVDAGLAVLRRAAPDRCLASAV